MLPERGDAGHAWNMFTLLLPFEQVGISRLDFQNAMQEKGISIGVHYPALPGASFYREMSYRPEAFPNAERIGRETVTLPLFPAMEEADVERVCAALLQTLAGD